VAGIVAVVMAAAGLVAYFGGGGAAQGQTGSGGVGKVATVNLYVIMKNYKKVEMYKKELETLEKPYVDKLTELKKLHDDWVKWAKENPNVAEAKKQEAQNNIVGLKRQIEDKQSEAQKVISKRAQEQIVEVYKAIELGIKQHAGPNGITLVLHYMEPVGQEYTPMNIDRKVNNCGNAGACFPVYMGPGVDISEAVVRLLNDSLGSTAASTGH
jgi:Skp family chaperone for outer membrane proteins